MGSRGDSLLRISKCRWGPLALPLEPTSAIRWPLSTNCPFFTKSLWAWA